MAKAHQWPKERYITGILQFIPRQLTSFQAKGKEKGDAVIPKRNETMIVAIISDGYCLSLAKPSEVTAIKHYLILMFCLIFSSLLTMLPDHDDMTLRWKSSYLQRVHPLSHSLQQQEHF